MNRRTRDCLVQFDALPPSIQAIARDKFQLFLLDPLNPALHNHELRDGGRGRHQPGSRSVWITHRYRALYITEDGVNIWYWVGTHSAYNIFTGSNS